MVSGKLAFLVVVFLRSLTIFQTNLNFCMVLHGFLKKKTLAFFGKYHKFHKNQNFSKVLQGFLKEKIILRIYKVFPQKLKLCKEILTAGVP